MKDPSLLQGFPFETDLSLCSDEPELIFWTIVMRHTVDDCPTELLQKACFNCCVDCQIWNIAQIYNNKFKNQRDQRNSKPF